MKHLGKFISKELLIFSGLFLTAFFLLIAPALAQEALPIEEALKQIIELYVQHKGSALGLTFVAVQGLMIALRTPLQSVAGKYKLLLVGLLTTVGAVIDNLMNGGSLASIIGDSVVWTSLMVFINQLIKQFSKKES